MSRHKVRSSGCYKKGIINNLTYENHFEPTLLIDAIEYCREDIHVYPEGYDHSIVEYLANHEYCDINTSDNMGITPFHFATKSGNLPAVKCLLARDRSVLNKTVYSRCPLHYAIAHKELAEFFLQQPDLDVNIQNYDKQTPDQLQGIDKNIKKMIEDYREKTRQESKK